MPTRKELESTACDLEKKLKEIEAELNKKELSLTHAREDMDELRSEWQLHDNNMKFMLGKAEVVDIKEFGGVKALLKTTRSKYDDMAGRYNNLLKSVTAYRKQVDEVRKELGDLKSELSGYPIILKFPEKT